jgi:hypothetical protein
MGEIHSTYESRLKRASGFIVMAAAAALPGVAVLILYLIKSIAKRIYVLIGLTVAFAIVAKCLTSAKKIEILTATGA